MRTLLWWLGLPWKCQIGACKTPDIVKERLIRAKVAHKAIPNKIFERVKQCPTCERKIKEYAWLEN